MRIINEAQGQTFYEDDQGYVVIKEGSLSEIIAELKEVEHMIELLGKSVEQLNALNLTNTLVLVHGELARVRILRETLLEKLLEQIG